jgi:hypothetical protein
MPGCPLRRTSTRPSDGADQNQKPKQSKNEAACQPTWLYDRTHSPVGAGLPAMDVNDNAGCLNERVVRSFFAGKPRSYRESRLLLISTTHQAER